MSFPGFSQSASAPATNVGADVVDILAEELSFRALSQGAEGATKLKILPKPWPTDNMPPASVTLLSVASKPGLLAAAGPDTLIVASTEKVRKAFQKEPGEWDIISDFEPDASMSVPTLRHVAFSAEGDFLVISAENGGGLAVYDPREIVKQNFKPGNEIGTDKQPIRALLPNPTPEMEHIFAAVLDNGKLCLIDVAKGASHTIREEGVLVASWSTKGKALAVGLKDGTGALYLNNGTEKGIIPRPPALNEGFTYSGLVWLANDEFFITHFPKKSAIDTGEPEEGKYHYVRSNKGWTSFSFHPISYEPCLPAYEMPPRAFPPRLSAIRLRNWEPDLDDLLIVTNSHTDTIATVTSASKELQRGGPINEYTLTGLNEGQAPLVPRRVFGEEGDSLLVGEALDLSATEKILRPISTDGGITEAPHPLPAYMFLTHQGLLSAYWVLWNRSIEQGKRYPGLVTPDSSSSTSDTQAAVSKPSKIPTPGFGNPSTPSKPGSSPFSTTTPATAFGKSAFGAPSTMGSSSPFGQPAKPAFGAPSAVGSSTPFGQPSKPAFGAPSTMGSSSPFGQPAKPAFGAPSAMGSPSPFGQVAGSTTPAFGQTSKPSLGAATGSTQPAFGQSSKPAFGAPAGLSKASPWGTASPQASSTPANNPFASGGQSSGFAKLNTNASGSGSGSGFSSFASANGTQSGFAGLGQQKSAFGAPSNNASSALKAEPSFGSTVTVGSNNGSTLPSWGNTPSQQQSSIFGQKTTNSSFATSSSFASTDSGLGTEQRKRDEATPTPQPSSVLPNLNNFKLVSGFKPEVSEETDDAAESAAPSTGGFFGSDFSSTVPKVGSTPVAPLPVKKEPVDDAPLPPDFTKSSKKSEPVDDAPLPPDFITKPKSQPEDAPLPPDFVTKKSSKAEDDLPPLAGSPGVKVEAPGSSPEATPFDDDDDDDDDDEEQFSDEDEEGQEESEESEVAATEYGEDSDDREAEEEEEEEEENQGGGQQPTTLGKYVLQQPDRDAPTQTSSSANTTKPSSLFGARPTTNQTGSTSSLFGAKPAGQTGPSPSLFGAKSISQPSSSQSLFAQPKPVGQQVKTTQPSFPPPRPQEILRSPSPVRSSSAASHRPTTRREPSMPGSSLSASFQQSKPSSPQVSDLEDQEDERIRAQLARDIEPSRTLDEFVAHQKYAGTSERTGHAAQIEAIYKDINGMVDALGWNARSIKSFTEYHKQPQSNHKVDRQAMEDVEADGKDGSWFDQFALCEIKGLKSLEDELSKELDAGRIQDVHDKLTQLRRLVLEKAKLMTRINDIRRQIMNRKDPERLESTRKAALPKELADTQKTLRADYAKLLILLSQAEEATILLRSRLASHNASGGNTSAVPSMDAVKKTIIKMTSMAERKNSDIALLESQLRKLGLQDPSRPTSSSSPANGATTPRRSRGPDLRRSIAETPFVTPPTKGKMSLTELNRRALTPEVADTTPSKGYGLFYDAQETSAGSQLVRVSDMVDDSIEELHQTAKRRRAVASSLRKALLDRGVKTTLVN